DVGARVDKLTLLQAKGAVVEVNLGLRHQIERLGFRQLGQLVQAGRRGAQVGGNLAEVFLGEDAEEFGIILQVRPDLIGGLGGAVPLQGSLALRQPESGDLLMSDERLGCPCDLLAPDGARHQPQQRRPAGQNQPCRRQSLHIIGLEDQAPESPEAIPSSTRMRPQCSQAMIFLRWATSSWIWGGISLKQPPQESRSMATSANPFR